MAQNIPPLPMGEIIKYLSAVYKMRPAIAGRGWNDDFHQYAPHETAIFCVTEDELRRSLHRAVPKCFAVTSIAILDCDDCAFLGKQNITTLCNCVGLNKLEIYNCKEITDITALGNCVCLKKLELGYCEKITDIAALGNCVRLKELDLDRCKKITDITALVCLKKTQTPWLHCLWSR